ncbi:hypothetical protein ACROYT_G027836 [Oculina patagonica]
MDYKVIVTKTLLKKLAIAAWLFAVFTKLRVYGMMMPSMDFQIVKIWRFGEGILIVSCLVAITYFYVIVYLGVRKRKVNDISNVTVLMKAKQQSKVAKTTAMLTAALILSFTPRVAFLILRNIFAVFLTNSALRLTEVVVQLNSLASPILYYYRDRRFRKAVLELLGIGKPPANQLAVGAAQFVRRKNPFGSVELQNEQKPRLITRSASCDPAVVFLTNSALRLTEVVVQLNSLASPILYCYRDRRFRKAVLELLGIGKPPANQLAVGAAQSVRRKNPFGSVELQNEQKPRLITRSASCDPVVGLDFVQPLAKPDKILLRRSKSAPKLDKCSSSLVGPQLDKPSSNLITSATVHVERGAPRRAKKTNRVLPNHVISSQGASHPTRKLQRSKS